MTAEQRFVRDLPDILADLYLESAPDYRHDLVRQIVATPQRAAWTFPERWLPMSVITLARQTLRPLPWRTIGLLAALALLAILAIVAYIGTRHRVPLPYGPAANGTLAVAEVGDIVLIDPATGRRTVAVGGPEEDGLPTFSLDGTKLAFLRDVGGRHTVMLADEHGGNIRELSTAGLGDPGTIEWAPDGTTIMTNAEVNGRRSIGLIPTDGSASRLLDLGIIAEDPVWIPTTGNEILFRTPSTAGTEFGYGLYAVHRDGSGLRELVPPHDASVTGCTTTARWCEWDALYFAPSPDGSKVAYQLRGPQDVPMKIMVMPVGGGPSTALSQVESVGPTWSPDGTWIAFFSFPVSNGVATTVRADGSGSPASHGPGPINDYVWTPDGTRLVVVDTGGGVMLYDPNGGAPSLGGWMSQVKPSWQRLAPAD